MISLERYRALIRAALKRKNFYETLVGEQLILEGLGEMILRRIHGGLIMRKAGFERLTRRLLLQEETHHAFGCRLLERAISVGDVCAEALKLPSLEYLYLLDAMLLSLADLFEFFDEDPSAYGAEVRRELPVWLTSHANEDLAQVQ